MIPDFLGYCPVGLDVSNLGPRLAEWRRAEGLTQRDVAARIGCDETTRRDVETEIDTSLHMVYKPSYVDR